MGIFNSNTEWEDYFVGQSASDTTPFYRSFQAQEFNDLVTKYVSGQIGLNTRKHKLSLLGVNNTSVNVSTITTSIDPKTKKLRLATEDVVQMSLGIIIDRLGLGLTQLSSKSYGNITSSKKLTKLFRECYGYVIKAIELHSNDTRSIHQLSFSLTAPAPSNEFLDKLVNFFFQDVANKMCVYQDQKRLLPWKLLDSKYSIALDRHFKEHLSHITAMKKSAKGELGKALNGKTWSAKQSLYRDFEIVSLMDAYRRYFMRIIKDNPSLRRDVNANGDNIKMTEMVAEACAVLGMLIEVTFTVCLIKARRSELLEEIPMNLQSLTPHQLVTCFNADNKWDDGF